MAIKTNEVTDGTSDCYWINTIDLLSAVIPILCDLPTSPPSLYVDLEGVDLGKNGTICLMQIYVLPLKRTYLIDVHVLGAAAFKTKAAAASTPVSTPTLKDILESHNIPKCLFDCRADSNAMYYLYGISVQGIQDLQLMEYAIRDWGYGKMYLNGLARCIEYDAGLSLKAVETFRERKKEGARLFAPEKGGSYEVFAERPMKAEILDYCIQDVRYLPELWFRYQEQMSPRVKALVMFATLSRVVQSRRPEYNPRDRRNCRGPW